MENHSRQSSGDSSPLSWEEPPPAATYKVKFLCSYGGQIQPRLHDNQLSYAGGDTKILSVERTTSFAALIAKLASICDSLPSAICFKYQLPGEDLDSLISVTNDEDLEHLMSEHDRLNRTSPKPARLRIFLFPVNLKPDLFEEAKSEGRWFIDALNSVQFRPLDDSSPPPPPANPDFLFGFDKAMDYNSGNDIPDLNDPVAIGEPVALIRQENASPPPISANYWPEMQVPAGNYHLPTGIPADQQPIYLIQGYYSFPAHNAVPPPPSSMIQQHQKVAGPLRPTMLAEQGYNTQVSYVDNAGRPVYYTMAPPPSYQVVSLPATAMGEDSKAVGGKAPQSLY